MVPFPADEDFNGRIVRGLFLRLPDADLLRVEDVGLQGADDPTILQWTADQGRILLTHDARSMPRHVRDRLAAGLHIPGVFIVDDFAPIGACVDDIELVAVSSDAGGWSIRSITFRSTEYNPAGLGWHRTSPYSISPAIFFEQ